MNRMWTKQVKTKNACFLISCTSFHYFKLRFLHPEFIQNGGPWECAFAVFFRAKHLWKSKTNTQPYKAQYRTKNTKKPNAQNKSEALKNQKNKEAKATKETKKDSKRPEKNQRNQKKQFKETKKTNKLKKPKKPKKNNCPRLLDLELHGRRVSDLWCFLVSLFFLVSLVFLV